MNANPEGRGPGSDLATLIDGPALGEDARRYLRARWLDQVHWMDARAAATQRLHLALRLSAIFGGVAIPAVVGWQGDAPVLARVPAAALGVVVAAASAVDGFLHPDERWRHYRRAAEALKSEFWRFAHHADPYRHPDGLDAALPGFVARVEDVLWGDADYFFAAIRPRPDAPEPSGPSLTLPGKPRVGT